MSDMPNRDQIQKGSSVLIETKDNQGSGNLTNGIVDTILTHSTSHPHGIKVRLQDGQVGRVKKLGDDFQSGPESAFEDLEKKVIPKTEDESNEFKEFYQYDPKMKSLIGIPSKERKKSIEGIKCSVQERFAIAVCSFGNSYGGGFVYLGIRDDGIISGLESDKNSGNFSNYSDEFANHMVSTLEKLLKDKVFIASKISIKFRKVNDKTICIIRVLPADRPIYLHAEKSKRLFVRGAAPRATKLDEDEQFKYIKTRFPGYV